MFPAQEPEADTESGNSAEEDTEKDEEAGENTVSSNDTENTESTENSEDAENGEDADISKPEGGAYIGDGYRVDVTVTDSWEGAYNIRLLITNTGDETLHNWGFVMETGDSITGLYNAVELSDQDGVRLIKNAGYNQDIRAGESAELGYTAYYEGSADVPREFALSHIEKKVETTECEVSLFVTDEWEDGGMAQIILENTSGQPIEDWMLEFDSELSIAEIWGGVIESHEEEHFFIRNADYAQNIPAGEAWTVGILFNGSSDDIQNIEMKQVVVSEEKERIDVQPALEDNEIEESSIVELDTSLATEDVGRVFYKKIRSDDEIILSVDGLGCVRDQLVVKANEGMEYEEIEEYVSSNDAKIVGCIEGVGYYQIEYNNRLDNQELEEKRLLLESEAWVNHVNYNFIIYDRPDFHSSDPYRKGVVDEPDEWTPENPGGMNWGIEEIDLGGALMHAGVIPDTSEGSSSRIRMDQLKYARIGIIDSAFDEWHEDFCDNTRGRAFITTWNNFTSQRDLQEAYFGNVDKGIKSNESLGHGSHVAGIIGAMFNNGKGGTGVGIKSALYGFSLDGNTIKNLDEVHGAKDEFEKLFPEAKKNENISMSELFCAIYVLVAVGKVKAINYSMGGAETALAAAYGNSKAIQYLDQTSAEISALLSDLKQKGYDFLIVSSAGNANNELFYACDYTTQYPFGYIRKDHFEEEVENTNSIEDTFLKSIDTNKTYGGINSTATYKISVQAKFNNVFNYISQDDTNYQYIICVGAMNYNNSTGCYEEMDFNCTGDRVDIFAPGHYIFSCTVTDPPLDESDPARYEYETEITPMHGYKIDQGTSMAAPFVTGAISLAYSVNPDLKAGDLKSWIIETSRDRGLSKGVLNASNLIDSITHTGELHITVTDEEGNALPNTEVRICGRDGVGRYSMAYILMYDALDYSTTYINATTDENGFLSCQLPMGNYCILADYNRERGGFSKVGWYQSNRGLYRDGLKAGEIRHIDLTLQKYENYMHPESFSIQVKDNSKRHIDGATIRLYEGWGEIDYDSPVAVGTGDLEGSHIWGWVGLSTVIGCYTAEVEKEGYQTIYLETLVFPEIGSTLVYLDEN